MKDEREWLNHVQIRVIDAPIKKSKLIQVERMKMV